MSDERAEVLRFWRAIEYLPATSLNHSKAGNSIWLTSRSRRSVCGKIARLGSDDARNCLLRLRAAG